jgi:hypothetical protein
MDVTRALTARRLASELSGMAALAAAIADAEVWSLTREHQADEVAEALGVSLPAVRKAIQVHNKRVAKSTDSGILISAKRARKT